MKKKAHGLLANCSVGSSYVSGPSCELPWHRSFVAKSMIAGMDEIIDVCMNDFTESLI